MASSCRPSVVADAEYKQHPAGLEKSYELDDILMCHIEEVFVFISSAILSQRER